MARIILIDKQKLNEELKKRHLSATKVSSACGYASNYLAAAFSKSRGISEVFVKFLQYQYGIDPETYTQVKEKKPDGRTIGQEMIAAIREQTEEIKKFAQAFNALVGELERKTE